jgi:hypothetical protein
MSSRSPVITQHEVKRVLKGAAEAGITMGILVTKDGALFLPIDTIKSPSPASALEAWKAARDAEKKEDDLAGRVGS